LRGTNDQAGAGSNGRGGVGKVYKLDHRDEQQWCFAAHGIISGFNPV
jgi:hypothetical protein